MEIDTKDQRSEIGSDNLLSNQENDHDGNLKRKRTEEPVIENKLLVYQQAEEHLRKIGTKYMNIRSEMTGSSGWSNDSITKDLKSYSFPSLEEIRQVMKVAIRFITLGTAPHSKIAEMLSLVSTFACHPESSDKRAFSQLYPDTEKSATHPLLLDFVEKGKKLTTSIEIVGKNYHPEEINDTFFSEPSNVFLTLYHHIFGKETDYFYIAVSRISHIFMLLCRLMVKNEENVRKAFPDRAHRLFTSVYNAIPYTIHPVELNENCWNLMRTFNMKDNSYIKNLIAFICREIKVTPENTEAMINPLIGFFNSTCMLQLYGNGMPIITLPIVLAHRYNVSEEKILGMFTSEFEIDSLNRIIKMHLEVGGKAECSLWPYARIISDVHFKHLSAKFNSSIYVKMVALLDNEPADSQNNIFTKINTSKLNFNIDDVLKWAAGARKHLKPRACFQYEAYGAAEEIRRTVERDSRPIEIIKPIDGRLYPNFESGGIINPPEPPSQGFDNFNF